MEGGYAMEKKIKTSCPCCGKAKDVIRIVYGLPAQELIEQAGQGKIKLGGCDVGDKDLYCKGCNYEFSSKNESSD